MVHTPVPFVPTRDSRASTIRLLLAQADRWIETHLDSAEEIITLQVRHEPGGMSAEVHVYAETFERALPGALVEGAALSRRLTQDGCHVLSRLHWPALGVACIALTPVGRRMPTQPAQPTRAA